MARELGGRVMGEAVRGVITAARAELAFALRRGARRVPLPMTSPHEAVVVLAKNGLLDHADWPRHAGWRHLLRERAPDIGSPATSLA